MKAILKKIKNLIKQLFMKNEPIIIKEEDIQSHEDEFILEDEDIFIENEKSIEEEKTEVNLVRTYFCNTYTIGHLYADDRYICDTIEDTDRGLYNEMCEEEISSKKIYGETAIPYGRYEIDMATKSPKYSNFEKYSWAKPYGGYIPRLLKVKGFEGILLHPGNTEKDTCGCLIVGENKVKGKVINSTVAFNKLMNEILLPATKKGKKIFINIIKKASY